MKVLIFGDIYGRVGRKALKKHIPDLKQQHSPDLIITNIDNITSGRGPIEKHVLELKNLGIDVMTGGNHIFDNEKKVINCLDSSDNILLRPANLFECSHYKIPGKGYTIIEKNKTRTLVIHLIGSIFMGWSVYNPFLKTEEILNNLRGQYDNVIIDFHRETSSELHALSLFLDGKVAFIYGTHTHVQTNDEYILDGKTGFITDVGMNGPFPSIIGADFKSLKKRFLTGINRGKIEQSLNKNYVISAVLIEIKDNKCLKIEKINFRGCL